MRLKPLLIILMLLCSNVFTYAQYENVWVFGIKAGLDFNVGSPPTPFLSSAASSEANASVCDRSGKLLFYTEGDYIWDRNGDYMPNGMFLTGNVRYKTITNSQGQQVNVIDSSFSNTSSTAQGALIVPFPDDTNKYYVFSLGQISFASPTVGKLYYSVVDMRLNGGLGDVVSGEKGILIDSNAHFTEHMTAVTGDNCNRPLT